MEIVCNVDFRIGLHDGIIPYRHMTVDWAELMLGAKSLTVDFDTSQIIQG